jgi:hypothetical protein
MHGARLVAQGLAVHRNRLDPARAIRMKPPLRRLLALPAGRSCDSLSPNWDRMEIRVRANFLAGIATHYARDPCRIPSGHIQFPYRVVGGFDLVSHDLPSGSRGTGSPGGWTLYARVGVVTPPIDPGPSAHLSIRGLLLSAVVLLAEWPLSFPGCPAAFASVSSIPLHPRRTSPRGFVQKDM